MQPSVFYLGHQVDAEGLHTTADKVESFLKAPVPTNMQELCSFLGLLNYYGKFLPIAFASRTLTASEQNYSQLKRKPWSWLLGLRNSIHTCSGATSPWSPTISPCYPFWVQKGYYIIGCCSTSTYGNSHVCLRHEVEFKSTHHHGNANGLWWLPLSVEVGPEYSAEPSIFNISQIEALPVTASAVRKATRKDLILRKVFQYTRLGWPSLHSLSMVLKPFSTWQHELSIEDGCLMWGIRVIIPIKVLARTHAEGAA